MVKEIKSNASIGTTFNRGLEIYKKNFVPLFVAFLLAILVGGISCGICSAPLFCGVFAMILKAMRDSSAVLKIGDVFQGFQKFVPAFVSFLLLGLLSSVVDTVLMVIPILGWIAVIVIGCAIYPAVVMLSLLLVADQDASVGDAIMVPLKLLKDKRFWSFILVSFVAGLLGAVGLIACGIGVLFTMPLAYCMIVAAYAEMYADGAPVAVAEPPPAELPAS